MTENLKIFNKADEAEELFIEINQNRQNYERPLLFYKKEIEEREEEIKKLKAEKLFIEINQNRQNYERPLLFYEKEIEEINEKIKDEIKKLEEKIEECQGLWIDIRTPCTSSGDFDKFWGSLHKLMNDSSFKPQKPKTTNDSQIPQTQIEVLEQFLEHLQGLKETDKQEFGADSNTDEKQEEIFEKGIQAEKLVIKINEYHQDFWTKFKEEYHDQYREYCDLLDKDGVNSFFHYKENFAPYFSVDLFDRPLKGPVFKPVIGSQRLWMDIRTPCMSLGDFNNFLISLYKLMYDTTRFLDVSLSPTERSPKEKTKETLPDQIKNICNLKNKDNPSVDNKYYEKECIVNIIGTLRNRYAHVINRDDEEEKKEKYPDILETYKGNKLEPETEEDFKKMQIKILEKLLDFLKEVQKSDGNNLKGYKEGFLIQNAYIKKQALSKFPAAREPAVRPVKKNENRNHYRA